MPVVHDQAGPPSLELGDRKMDRLRIELRVIQKRQLTKPPELTGATSDTTREPIRDRDADDAFTPACVKDDSMECAKRRDALRRVRRLRDLSAAHVDQGTLIRKARAHLRKFKLCDLRRHRDGSPMGYDEPEPRARHRQYR